MVYRICKNTGVYFEIYKNTAAELRSAAQGPFITKFSAWAPGVEKSNEWDEWALGKREISVSSVSPDIAFTDAKFRRRLSQISKMTIQVVHDLLPAAFSLSVFNAPAALASIAFGLKGGYSAIYPGKNSFASGLILAEAAFFCGESQEIIFINADAEIPSEYNEVISGNNLPLAFAFLLSGKRLLEAENGGFSIPLSSLKMGRDTPEDFLRRLILARR